MLTYIASFSFTKHKVGIRKACNLILHPVKIIMIYYLADEFFFFSFLIYKMLLM